MNKVWSLSICFFLVVLGFTILVQTLWRAWPLTLAMFVVAPTLYLLHYRRL